MPQEKLTTYLSQLTGSDVRPDQSLALRSAQKAAFAAWLRKQGIAVDFAQVNQGRFSINGLLNGEAAPAAASREPAALAPAPAATNLAGTIGGIGLDIEDLDSLPDAHDYREHEFYRDNFAPSEIVYCIQQPDVKASFAGLWAAKEAAIKSGAAKDPLAGLRAIEISHDSTGRPTYPGCVLSISHTPKTAAAVCLWTGAPATQIAAPVAAKEPNLALKAALASRASAETGAKSGSKRWLKVFIFVIVLATATAGLRSIGVV